MGDSHHLATRPQSGEGGGKQIPRSPNRPRDDNTQVAVLSWLYFSFIASFVFNALGGNCSQLVHFISTYSYPYQPVGLSGPPWGGVARYAGSDYGKQPDGKPRPLKAWLSEFRENTNPESAGEIDLSPVP
jgi:hypothetical protein